MLSVACFVLKGQEILKNTCLINMLTFIWKVNFITTQCTNIFELSLLVYWISTHLHIGGELVELLALVLVLPAHFNHLLVGFLLNQPEVRALVLQVAHLELEKKIATFVASWRKVDWKKCGTFVVFEKIWLKKICDFCGWCLRKVDRKNAFDFYGKQNTSLNKLNCK